MPELTLRDAMVLIGSLLILAVIVDAWRRMRKQQRSRVRMNLSSELPSDAPADDIAMFRELPNGGARVVGRDDDELAAEIANAVAGTPANEVETKRVESPVRKPLGPVGRTVEPDPSDQADSSDELPNDESPAPEQSVPDAPEMPDEEYEAADELHAMAGVSARDDEPANLDWLEDLPDPNQSSQDDDAGELPRDADSEVIVLHVISRQDPGFAGKDILEILLACDLRFGDMSFFHRHEQQAGRGAIQFSVANMMQPGVFDIDNMDAMRAKGLVFFVTLPGPEDMIQAFDYMLETARVVARNLNGELLDQSRSVLTQQAVEHSRQQIRELERRLLAKDR